MHLSKLQCRDELDFKYDINVKENVLDLNIDDYLDLAIRNNKKRRFLFVSKYLGKHLPCRAVDMDKLGYDIVRAYEKKQDYLSSGLVISFAETGTALGHSVFNYINADYEFVHTTREIVENKNEKKLMAKFLYYIFV
ncbi:MAG: phosphoribosyltransferase domain-containing protein [Intestinibacter sp.]